MNRISSAIFGLVALSLSVGCSGGGGTGPNPSTNSTPTPKFPSPGTTSVASFPPATTNSTSFNVSSVPAGLAVTVSGSTTASRTTPTTIAPPQSNQATSISIAPTNGNPAFVFLGDQRANGSHTVLYDQPADTMGSIGSIATSSVARLTSFARDAQTTSATALPRRISRGAFGRPAFSSTRLSVRYRSATLAKVGMRPLDVERSIGIGTGVDIGPEHDGVIARSVAVPAGTSIDGLAATLRARSDVLSAAPERLYYPESATSTQPNDTRFNNDFQWSEFAIKADFGWGYTTGSPGIAIAIVDTGADFNHPDLAGSKIMYAEGILNGVITSGNAAAQDTDGHGTNVAGIAAADTNNAFGFAGTGYNSSLQIYKVFGNDTAPTYSPSANSSDVSAAIYDAVKYGARVINLSLGTCQADGPDPVQRDAVTYALAHDVVVVAAAGNERAGGSSGSCSGNSTTVDFPAAYDGVIAVGASALTDAVLNDYTTATEKVASYSNSGPGLSLVAPGGDPSATESSPTYTGPTDYLHWIAGLYSSTAADPANQCSNKSACFALFAGTSQATPHVAGAAALMLALNSALLPDQIKTSLMATADDINDPNQGAGRLDIYRALAAVKGDPSPPSMPTNSNFVAFAYTPDGSNVPPILDVTYPRGVPVSSVGNFRVADIPATASGYKIGVWYDANGDGKVDAGDYFGSSTTTCSATAPCASATGIVVHPVAAGFVLN